MKHISAEASQAFMRKVILPLSGLVVGLMIFATAGIFWIAEYQTDVAIGQQARLANGALRIHAQKLGVSAADYGYWDEAVTAIVDKPNPTWITDNIGAGAEKSLGAAMSFALDREGHAIYSRVLGTNGKDDPVKYFPHGFQEAHELWKKMSPDKTYTGLVPYKDTAAIIAIAPIRSWEDAKRPPTGYSLLFVQIVDGPLLVDLARDYELTDLRIARSQKDISDQRATVSIRDENGQIVSRLAWDANRPGDELLKIALPFMAIFLTSLALLGAFVFRHAIASAQIITDREKKAFRDPLTNLANRSLFFNDLEKAISRIVPGESEISVMYIDLDGFKMVNDTMGHSAGDELLQQVAQRLRACVRSGDSVARLGGDEFAVIFPGNIDRRRLVSIGRKILDELSLPFQLLGGFTKIACSIGVAQCSDNAQTPAALIDRADRALYEAKASGKNMLRFHNDAPDAPTADRRVA